MTRAGTLAVALLASIALGAAPAFAELKVGLGGFTKLDGRFSDTLTTGSTTNRALPGPNAIPFDQGPNIDRVRSDNNQFILDVRESRFNITATDKFGTVATKGFIELDFFGGTDAEFNAVVSNSAVPRLRHAFLEGKLPLGPGTFTLLGGQTWDAFGYLTDISPPATVVFGGFKAGNLFARQPQVRLTYGLPFGKETLNFSAAVQTNASSFGTGGGTNGLGPNPGGFTNAVDVANQEGQDVPAFTAKVQWMGGLVQAEIAGIATRAKGILSGPANTESELIWGAQATVAVPIGPLRIFAHVDNLNGVNRLAVAPYRDVTFTAKQEIATINTLGLLGGVTYKLTPATSFNAGYGIRFPDSGSSGHSGLGRGARGQIDHVRQQDAIVNVLHKFWGRFQVGIEYERQWVEAFRNNEGKANSVHGALWYFF